ncbi:SIR2-like domain-containing protein [Lachnospiraceae bacterium YSD2013]|nr:SIR2-like domain-containing protein [Lachnospiraceae bacterium YSD2013]
MAKRGLEFGSIKPVLLDVEEWSLCIGAGTSVPLLPDWYTLVERMIDKYCDPKDKISIETYKKMGFSADAMIQAVRNHIGGTDEEFAKKLSEEVYAPIKSKLTNEEWKSFAKIHESIGNVSVTKADWERFEKIKDKLLNNTSANMLAEPIIKAMNKGVEPKSILTFNGEAIFLALLKYYYHKECCGKCTEKARFDRIVNGLNVSHSSRIPYVHCHGILPINGTKIKKGYKADTKLVFTEERYLKIANSPMSWQALQFIENCMNSKMVFVGVSLTDANMRRWLGWIHGNKMDEFAENGIHCKDSTEHFWIRKRPGTDLEKKWIEESVAHLGVRLVWIDDYNQIGEVLKKMLGL